MDAIKYLRNEHSKFRKQLTVISKTKSDNLKKTKFKSFSKDLARHERMEQKVWYPVLRKDEKLKKIIKHLISEEKKAGKALKDLNKKHIAIIWKIKFIKVKHDVDHHAKEEEKKLFPKVRLAFSKAELNTLGTKMRKFKARLKK